MHLHFQNRADVNRTRHTDSQSRAKHTGFRGESIPELRTERSTKGRGAEHDSLPRYSANHTEPAGTDRGRWYLSQGSKRFRRVCRPEIDHLRLRAASTSRPATSTASSRDSERDNSRVENLSHFSSK